MYRILDREHVELHHQSYDDYTTGTQEPEWRRKHHYFSPHTTDTKLLCTAPRCTQKPPQLPVRAEEPRDI